MANDGAPTTPTRTATVTQTDIRRPGRRLRPWMIGGALLLVALLRDWTISYCWASEARVWENAISVSPHSADIRAGLATAYMRQQRWREARDRLLEAAAVPAGPQLFVIYDNLGIVSYKLQEKDAAYRYFLQAYALKQDSVEVLQNLGSLLHEMGRPAEALVHLDRAMQVSPAYCEAHLEALMVARTLGDPLKANERIRRLPFHCKSDPRVGEIDAWIRRQGRLAAGSGREG